MTFVASDEISLSCDSELEESTSTDSFQNEKPTLLIIEDDHMIQELYSALLEYTEWEIMSQVFDGFQAKKTYFSLETSPTIVICDITLPDCSGIDLAREILDHNPNQKIIFVSGTIHQLEDHPDLKNIPRLGKPFKIDELTKKLQEIAFFQ
ncbi:MAG: response regulator [Candidatus Odinarchaeota archaeon]